MHWHTYWTAVGCTLCDDAAAVRAASAIAVVVDGNHLNGLIDDGEGGGNGECVHDERW